MPHIVSYSYEHVLYKTELMLALSRSMWSAFAPPIVTSSNSSSFFRAHYIHWHLAGNEKLHTIFPNAADRDSSRSESFAIIM